MPHKLTRNHFTLFLTLFLGFTLTEMAVAKKLSFAVSFNDISSRHDTFFVTAMPLATIELNVSDLTEQKRIFNLNFQTESVTTNQDNQFAFTAPKKPGYYSIEIKPETGDEVMKLTAFVLRPLSEMRNNSLNGYKIGKYPTKPLRGNPKYQAPTGLIEYTPDMNNLALTPNFKLRQFLCKQETQSKHKYLLVLPTLMLKLESLLEHTRERGIEADSFFVMSGYRTPHYNKAIGNVPNSRHVYGDAADIYVDENPRDGSMDDVNKDGKRNREDAHFLYDLASKLDQKEGLSGIQGGVGAYGANSAHGPFIHVDARGHSARWGRK